MGNFFKSIIDRNERVLSRLRKIVEIVNSHEPKMRSLSDEELRAKTAEFKERLSSGETLEDILPEAFAVVREASVRTIRMRHFDVQVMGAVVLHEGKIAEMKTGEGKTLVATMPIYLNALTGRGVHLVTVNDYLAKRDVQWMGPIYHFLGLSVAAIQGRSAETGEEGASYLFDPTVETEDPRFKNLRPCTRREAYLADITYGTNNEFGFDYLRDNLAKYKEELVQRELNYAIIDEVDSILIDEARTPLIISGMPEESTQLYYKVDRVVAQLRPQIDYTIDEKAKTAMLTEEGTRRVEQMLGIQNLADIENIQLKHHVDQALKARTVYKRDIDYVVKDGQVIIVDEFTGRLMFGRRYSEGLHQAIEAKEGVRIEHETRTVATISFQNYFRLYNKLAGMTGTAKTEENEFIKIYGLEVVVIPTHKPMIRIDYPDVVWKSEEAKFRGVVSEILQCYARQQPVLVGSRSIEVSERLSERLKPDKLRLLGLIKILKHKMKENKALEGDKRKKFEELLNRKLEELSIGSLSGIARALGVNPDVLRQENFELLKSLLGIDSQNADKLSEALQTGIPHNVLNAKYHEREAQIIAEAGRKGAVTIATNMAGRGVDIILGGKPEDPLAIESPHHDEVAALGGLHILGSERHEARRIDNQLRGRSGRQGDPGSSRFHVSFEDELMRLFGTSKDHLLIRALPEDEPIESKLFTKAIERAQKKVESHNFDIRHQLLKYDEVMNTQRKVIYGSRRKILEGADMKANVLDMLEETIKEQLNLFAGEQIHPSEWDLEGLYNALFEIFPIHLYLAPEDLRNRKRAELEELLIEAAKRAYEEKEKEVTPEMMRNIERFVMLQVIDTNWMQHLDEMDYLREGIGLRGYAQIDPFIAYQKEAFDMFERLKARIREDVVKYVFRVQVAKPPRRSPYRVLAQAPPAQVSRPGGEERAAVATAVGTKPTKIKKKLGRNDPCPCGSGKKFKKCHWGQDISQFLQ